MLDESRYDDAYRVARMTIRTARIVRVLGLLFSAFLVIVGLIVTVAFHGASIFAIFISLVSAGLFALVTIAVSTIMAAQAQMMAAVVDTAINSSPLLSTGQKESAIQPLR